MYDDTGIWSLIVVGMFMYFGAFGVIVSATAFSKNDEGENYREGMAAWNFFALLYWGIPALIDILIILFISVGGFTLHIAEGTIYVFGIFSFFHFLTFTYNILKCEKNLLAIICSVTHKGTGE